MDEAPSSSSETMMSPDRSSGQAVGDSGTVAGPTPALSGREMKPEYRVSENDKKFSTPRSVLTPPFVRPPLACPCLPSALPSSFFFSRPFPSPYIPSLDSLFGQPSKGNRHSRTSTRTGVDEPFATRPLRVDPLAHHPTRSRQAHPIDPVRGASPARPPQPTHSLLLDPSKEATTTCCRSITPAAATHYPTASKH